MSLSRLARLSAAVVSMGVLSSVSQAQVLTADTITGSVVPYGYVLNTNEAFSQTFTGAGRLDLVTFRFFLVPTDTNSVAPVDVPFALSAWSSGQSTGTAVTSGVFSLAAGSSWTPISTPAGFDYYFDSTFDFGGLTIEPSTTYGISLFGAPATNNFIGVGTTNGLGNDNSLYADGSGFWDSSASNIASLTTGNSALPYDLMFSAIGSPVPEASSAAVLFAGLFVGGLMLRRRPRQVGEAGFSASATQA